MNSTIKEWVRSGGLISSNGRTRGGLIRNVRPPAATGSKARAGSVLGDTRQIGAPECAYVNMRQIAVFARRVRLTIKFNHKCSGDFSSKKSLT
jgi:hypothetical protein